MSVIDRKRYPNFGNIDFFEKDMTPQSMQFMIDLLPTIRKLISGWPSKKILEVLDVGTATGAGANLLATLFKGEFFGVKMKVDALDRKNNKYDPYPIISFPNINYIVADIFDLDKNITWDLIVCSHTIEHMSDPFPFITQLQKLARRWVLIYCPFDEYTLIPGHEISITKDIVDSLQPSVVEILDSPGWSSITEDRKCILFVLQGSAPIS
jgi:SAM-dependent methyltransferase